MIGGCKHRLALRAKFPNRRKGWFEFPKHAPVFRLPLGRLGRCEENKMNGACSEDLALAEFFTQLERAYNAYRFLDQKKGKPRLICGPAQFATS
jgi:hypothetical protein